MQRTFSKILTVILASSVIFGCDTPQSTACSAAASVPAQMPLFFLAKPEPKCLWRCMADNFKISSNYKNPRVQRHIKLYSREDSHYLIKFSKQASPYLYHITKLLEEHNMPSELALLPIVESEYRPQATSRMGAAGLWQLAPGTGKLYGLKQDYWYDGRRDVDAATRAAIGHLKFLYEKFNQDWLLALAAYNAGDARVSSAIRTNKRLGKPTDYWSLSLPTETLHFVPKFLALVYLVGNASDLNIALEPIPNKPYFSKVDLPAQIEVQQAAKLAGIDINEFKQLNPALRAHATHPNGPHQIILPVKNIAQFQENYQTVRAAKQVAKATSNGKYHTVVKGDTLNMIAAKYSTTVKSIKSKNKLKSDIIRSGQKLAI